MTHFCLNAVAMIFYADITHVKQSIVAADYYGNNLVADFWGYINFVLAFAEPFDPPDE